MGKGPNGEGRWRSNRDRAQAWQSHFGERSAKPPPDPGLIVATLQWPTPAPSAPDPPPPSPTPQAPPGRSSGSTSRKSKPCAAASGWRRRPSSRRRRRGARRPRRRPPRRSRLRRACGWPPLRADPSSSWPRSGRCSFGASDTQPGPNMRTGPYAPPNRSARPQALFTSLCARTSATPTRSPREVGTHKHKQL